MPQRLLLAPWTVRGLSGGVEPVRRTLHARSGKARPGEADRAEMLVLTPGTAFAWPAGALEASMVGGRAIEWLVLSGEVFVDGERLAEGDFLRHALSAGGHRVEAIGSARVYVRLAAPVLGAAPERRLARAAEAAWDGIPGHFERRVLWVDDVEAVVLLRASAGFAIPAHRHRIDEECLVLAGEVLAGPGVLHAGDFQLVPAESLHDVVRAMTDSFVYLRGDTETDFVREPK